MDPITELEQLQIDYLNLILSGKWAPKDILIDTVSHPSGTVTVISWGDHTSILNQGALCDLIEKFDMSMSAEEDLAILKGAFA